MPDAAKVYVKRGVNAATGELNRWWHPTQFRRPVPDAGGYVPDDLDTARALLDGSLVKAIPEASPAEEAPKPARATRASSSDDK